VVLWHASAAIRDPEKGQGSMLLAVDAAACTKDYLRHGEADETRRGFTRHSNMVLPSLCMQTGRSHCERNSGSPWLEAGGSRDADELTREKTRRTWILARAFKSGRFR